MSLYTLISSFLSYVFTTIIYLFIFSIIVLIYKDIKKVSKNMDNPDESVEDFQEDELTYEDDEEDEIQYTAILKTVITRESKRFNLRKRYRIGEGPIVIGRSDECDISIPDVYLSQEHFEIRCKKGNWYIKDLKSKNGTFLNDVPVSGSVILEDNDVISFGDIEFIFNVES